ncbi:hypothetical protein DL769_007529 [Monosporascus sp. CRB-8-3]|nr:hypothetical protein DL769_007529 [Monosporascus sp. CRB-8-3]
MPQPIPKTTKQWNATSPLSGLDSLRCTEQYQSKYRDVIATQGKYPFDLKPGVVPGSERAGTVLAIGKHVTRFKPGNEVPTTTYQQHLAGPIDSRTRKSGLGGSIDSTPHRETPDWECVAKELTGGFGVDHVMDVAGPASLERSVASVKLDGVINVVGFVGDGGHCRSIAANPDKLRFVIDAKVFTLDQVKEAYE